MYPGLCQKYWQLQYLWTVVDLGRVACKVHSGPYLKVFITEQTGLVSCRARNPRAQQSLYPKGDLENRPEL